MDDTERRLRDIAARIPNMPTARFSERETERCLVEPLLEALGYDARNPAEVESQHPIRLGSTTKNCDFAIKIRNQVRVLVECKKPNVALDDPGQLASYFSQVPTALLGLYTNGLEFRFYAERNQGRVKQMDREPFLVLDLRNLDETATRGLAKCAKSGIEDDSGFRQWVGDLRYLSIVRDRLRREMVRPSDEFVNLAMDWADAGDRTPQSLERFRHIVTQAAATLLNHAASPTVPAPKMPEGRVAHHDSGGEWVSLTEVKVEPKGRNAPHFIRHQGKQRSLKSWRGVTEQVAYWLYQDGLLTPGDCEIPDASHRTLHILSLQGRHPGGRPFRHGGQEIQDTGIKIDTQRSGREFVQNARMLLERFGWNPSKVELKMP